MDKTSNSELPVVKSRKGVEDLFERGGKPTGTAPEGKNKTEGQKDGSFEEDVSLAEKVWQTNPLIHPQNILIENLCEEPSIRKHAGKRVFDALARRHAYDRRGKNRYQRQGAAPGASDGEETKEKFPPTKMDIPWSGRELNIWTDGHVLLFGRAARAAFEDTWSESIRRARQMKSPYRQAGLTPDEAAEAEKRRIEKQKKKDLPSGLFESIPTDRGAEIHRIGYRARRKPRKSSFHGLNVLLSNHKEGTVTSVRRDVLGLALRQVRRVMPGVERRGRLRLCQPEGEIEKPIRICLKEWAHTDQTVEQIESAAPIGFDFLPSLVGAVMPLTPNRQTRGVWEKLPDAIKADATEADATEADAAKANAAKGQGKKEDRRRQKLATGKGEQGSLFE